VHSSTKYLGLFTGLTNYGLSAPSHLAWPTMNGPRTFKRGELLGLTNMAQNWILVWWAGAEGWTNWDSPWVVFLQHRPDAMSLDEDGLHLEFPHAAGDVVMIPLYGYEKPPQQGHDFRAQHGLPAPKIPVKTWEWPKVVTRDPLTRIRYWASALREFPVYCEDTFSVDRAKDSVTIRSRFQWRSINDDWNTPHLKLGPLSPPLAHAAKIGGFPVEFSKKWFDLNYSTPYGPYLAVEGVDEFDAAFSVLQYVNETEAFAPPAVSERPRVRSALSGVQAAAKYQENRGDLVRAILGTNWTGQTLPYELVNQERPGALFRGFLDAGWIARTLPYLGAEARSNAVLQLRKKLLYDYLAPDRFSILSRERFEARTFPGESGREYVLLRGFRTDSRDSSTITFEGNSDVLKALWAYAHFTGDWGTIKEHWLLLRKLFVSPAETRWSGFGRTGIAELDSQAAHCAAFARMAYKVGDMDAYNYGCYLFARELVLLYVKQRGAEYFRQHQPLHSMEFMDEEVFLTHLSTDTAGWLIDGPKFPALATERRFNERWMRYSDVDIARFYRDYLKDDVRRELNWLQHRWEPQKKWFNEPEGLPSLLQLRSFLLNESAMELPNLATNAQRLVYISGGVANDLSVLRTSRPTRFDRLIPPGDPSPFVAGLERDIISPASYLVTALDIGQPEGKTSTRGQAWPQLTWPAWKTPSGAPWSFGHIRPTKDALPAKVQIVELNWTTRVLVFTSP